MLELFWCQLRKHWHKSLSASSYIVWGWYVSLLVNETILCTLYARIIIVSIDTVIRVQGLVKEYGSGDNIVRAIDRANLEIQSGEFLMITGRNGSGKSTLMHLMALLDDFSEGEITLFGNKVSGLKPIAKSKLRLKEVGYIFQEYALIQELTTLENVMLPALMLGSIKQAKEKAHKLLDKVDLGHKENRLPSQLSGGEQQRVAIARALINEPKIIFADEPTANLDSFASKDVLEIFRKLNKDDGITLIMVTHEPEELTYATRTISLKDGKIYEK